jgi:hypothetical protein
MNNNKNKTINYLIQKKVSCLGIVASQNKAF